MDKKRSVCFLLTVTMLSTGPGNTISAINSSKATRTMPDNERLVRAVEIEEEIAIKSISAPIVINKMELCDATIPDSTGADDLTLSPSYNLIVKDKKVKQEIAKQKRLEQERLEEEKARKREKKRLARKAKEEAERKEKARILSVDYYSTNLTKLSGITRAEMKALLADTSMSHLSSAFVDAEQTYGVNAFFMAGLVALESGWCRSDRAKRQNNVTGMAVYKDSSPGYSYPSQYACVLDTARQLGKNYLRKEGKYYNGFSAEAVNKCYSASPTWAVKINAIANSLSNEYDQKYK